MNDDEKQIRQLVDTWISATRAGDVDTILALMAPDAIFLAARQPPMVGRDAFAQGMRAVLSEHVIETTCDIDEVAISGDLAYCRTRLAVTIASTHGKLPMQRTGHTLTIYRKGADGRWVLTRDANMLAPAN
mgnify:CR=1 FL=1